MAAVAHEAELPAGAVASRGSRFAIVLIGFFFATQAVDPIISTNALVSASRGLSMSAGITSLAASISTLALAATVLSTGALADRLGRRRLLMIALVASMVGDLLVAASPAWPIYLLGRVIAGVGLGAAYCAAFAFIESVVPRERVAQAVGQAGAVAVAAMIVLSVLGGQLAALDWRLAFLIVPLCCLIGLVATPRMLPVQPRIKAAGGDVPAQILVGLSVILLLYGASQAVKGITRPAALIGLLGGLAVFALFALRERGRKERFFPVEVLITPLFLGAVASGFIYNLAQSSIILQASDAWQYVNRFKPSMVSLGEIPLFLAAIAGALVFGRLMGRGMKPRTAVLIGGLATAAGFFTLLPHKAFSPYLTYVPALLLIGFGSTGASVPYGTLVLQSIGKRFKEFYGPITSSRTTMGQFFYALGMSLSMLIVTGFTNGGVVHRLVKSGVPRYQVGEGLDELAFYVKTGHERSTELARKAMSAAHPSYAHAFAVTMGVLGVLMVIAAVAGWKVLGTKHAAVQMQEDAPSV